jgi:hypothetical protein
MAQAKVTKKDLLRDILPDNSDMPDESLPAAPTKKAPPKKGKPKKGDPFPKTKSAYLFIVKQIKKHGLFHHPSPNLGQAPARSPLSGCLSECTNLFHHQHNKEELNKRFPKTRLKVTT